MSDFLTQNSAVIQNIIEVALSCILSSIVAYIFYKKQIIDKKPLYNIYTKAIIKNNDPLLAKHLQVTVDGVIINELNLTIVLFLNNGKNSIRRNDLFEDDRLRIHFLDDPQKILMIRYCTTSKITSSFRIDQVNNELNLDFNAIQKGQGFIILIYHTSIKPIPMELLGDIEGVKKIKQISDQKMAEILNPTIVSDKKTLKKYLIILSVCIPILIIGLLTLTSDIRFMITLLSSMVIFSVGMPSIFISLDIHISKNFNEFTKLKDYKNDRV